MKSQALLRFSFASLVLIAMSAYGQESVFNVRDFGATGKKSGNAQPFLQRAIDSYACERLVIDGVYIRSSLAEGVWADGIDPDGCKDVRISNCTIETGDDAIVFYSMNWFGPALPCENITVTNCRLSSASTVAYDKAVHALKFQMAKNLKLRNVEVFWGNPASTQWRSALYVEDAKGLEIGNFGGRQATLGSDVSALVLNRVDGAVIRDSRVQQGTSTYLSILGKESANVLLTGNDFRNAARSYVSGKEVQKNCVILFNNISGAR